MRYLYGDSEPFPPMYDFIGALESFVTHGARVAKLDAEIRVLHDQAQKAREARQKSSDELDLFHRRMMGALDKTLPADGDPAPIEYCRRLKEVAVQVVAETKKTIAAVEAQELQIERAEVERRRAEIFSSLESSLSLLRLPTFDVSVRMRLVDGRNEMAAVFSHADDLVTGFQLNSAKLPDWRQPRKVSEFATGIELPVGIKRGWFSRSVQQELASLDDAFIGSFDLQKDRTEICLRKRPTDKDSIAVLLERSEGKVSAQMHYLDDPEAEEHRAPLDAAATANLQRFEEGLRKGLAGVLTVKEKLLSVQHHGVDVIQQDECEGFIRNLVAFAAPIVAEIARRTPNAAELALKVEKEGGRREEIYVRKADLAKKLEILEPSQRMVFAALNLGEPPAAASSDEQPTIESAVLGLEDIASV